ncbi:hypothetical protein EB061_12920, partial [bacterium]|nr:hypothetical protein [bacterium]
HFDSYPYDLGKPRRLSAAETSSVEQLIGQLGCYTCHVHAKPGQDPSALAPHFENVARRLNPSWVVEWLHNPAAIMPGTRMPTLWPSSNEDDSKAPRIGIPGFFGDDAEKQIEAVRNYLFYYQPRGPADYPTPREEPQPAQDEAKKEVPGPTAMN